MTVKPDSPPLKGFRRELTIPLFEQLCMLQCRKEEILGYVGTDPPALEKWCRKTYRRPLAEIMEMIRQDGIVEIRKAAFELQKKNATMAGQQITRFIGPPGPSPEEKARLLTEESNAAVRQFVELALPSRGAVEDLFREPEGEEEE